MDIFEECKKIHKHLESNYEEIARNDLILLLDYMQQNGLEYIPIVNHLIRLTGLYPYLNTENAILEDKLVYEVFKVDTGDTEPLTLHREQSVVLKRLLNGENLAVSAPTSFGKSFVIDSFIAIKKPKNILIIVPTIALTDEIRRRLYKKFSDEYKIITTTEVELADKNIFIFPQERAIGYIDRIEHVDLLVIDEFYKASFEFDKERSSSLQKAILKLGKMASQKYYLAPNIGKLSNNLFTEDMEFLPITFNTVFLSIHEAYKEIGTDEKGVKLLELLHKQADEKTLIYAGTYTEIDNILTLINQNIAHNTSERLAQFSRWLSQNYIADWMLTESVKRGVGIHNGRLHRSLSQLQIKLFEDEDGLNSIASTSSIIEGVNTSAKNVIVWKNKNGIHNLNSFTYKNIIGRGGRMFKHFVGNIYLFEKPPPEEITQLSIDFSENTIPDVDDVEYKDDLTKEQVSKIVEHKERMYNIFGKDVYDKLLKDDVLQSKKEIIEKIAVDMSENPSAWNSLVYLNNNHPKYWANPLYKVMEMQAGWDTRFGNFVYLVQILSLNWTKNIPELLGYLAKKQIGIDLFFQLERNVTFKLAALLSDINILQKYILNDSNIDISSFIAKISHAFLPSVVYQLEEYGLPRMLAKKIHAAQVIDFLDKEMTIHMAIERFSQIGIDSLKEHVTSFDEFDLYIIDYFYDGITKKERKLYSLFD